jgi:chemotaxis protein methyltransferase CheR
MKTVADLLAARYGLQFAGHNLDLLERGLRRLADSQGTSLEFLCRRLAMQDPKAELWQKLIDVVTVNETYLFRHPEQLQVLGQRLIPERLASGARTLRAWSAGCATGEEAYSLAMVMRGAAPSCEVRVLATDISEPALAVAERGKYGPNSLREPIPQALQDTYLLSASDGSVEVRPLLRELVEFRRVNLVDGDHLAMVPGGFDFIFCRNVLIYFTPEHNRQVLMVLRDRLADGGFLMLTALDQREKIPGLEPVVLDGVPLLRRSEPARLSAAPTRRELPAAVSVTPSRPLLSAIAADALERAAEVKAAADQGDLSRAAQLARRLLQSDRTPEALHLLAMILSEQGKSTEAEQLLLEALGQNPGYVLGHLSLGLLERPLHQKWRATQHLQTVITLLRQRADDEILHGPEPLQVAMARRLASAGLANLERRS